jgi:hypothetical protein
MKTCDCCDKSRNDVRTLDDCDVCFLCLREAKRGRCWNRKQGRYVYPELEVV